MNDVVHGPDWYNAQCPVCGKMFHLKPYALKHSKNHYCSRSCHSKAKQEYMKGKNNHQYGLKGDKNPSWKSNRRISSYGYILIRQLNHPFKNVDGFVFEHRLIAEEYLLNEKNSIEINGQKFLKPDLDVHHKNFIITDNRPENLEILTPAEHRKLHNTINPRNRNEKGRFAKELEMNVKVKKLTDTAIIPERKSNGAAGYDLYVDSENEITINPHETVILNSGLAFAIPSGYFGAIYARSGLSTKMGLRPATCVSIIDSDFRGEVGIPIHNDTDIPRVIKPHERVCQIIFEKSIQTNLQEVDCLDETNRGAGGFGSTG